MPKTEMEIHIRKFVLQLQGFYKSLLIYCAISIAFIVMWVVLNNDYFWPIWFILIFGIILFVRAVRLGIVPLFEDIFPFIHYQWVEEEVKKRLDKEIKKEKSLKKKSSESKLVKKTEVTASTKPVKKTEITALNKPVKKIVKTTLTKPVKKKVTKKPSTTKK